jgi:hypothetical protein
MLTALAYAIDQKGNRADAAALGKARNEGYEQGVKSTHGAYYEDQYNKLVDKVVAFEKASGLNIQYGWGKPERVGEIVKLIMNHDAPLKRILDTAKYNLSKTEDLKTEIERQIKVLESAMVGQKTEGDEEE